jgi:hypothetical protein
MNIKKNIATSDNGFIFNPATGDSFSANKIAALILTEIKAGKSEPAIKEDILNRYEVTSDQLNRDWDDYMMQIRDANLLEI